MAVTALLVDDEPLLLDYLAGQLAEVWPELNVCATAGNGREALAQIAALDPDVIFLDIRMPGLDGLEVARRCPAGVHIVFVTAYDEYAVAAFEQAAIDYLLKPVTAERLTQTVERVRRRLASEDAAPDIEAVRALIRHLGHAPAAAQSWLEWLRVGESDSVRLLPVAEIVYLQADHKYTTVVTADREFLVRTSIADLEARLDPTHFWRIHRSTLVNARAIDAARRDFRGRWVLTLHGRPERLRVSERYRHLFKQM